MNKYVVILLLAFSGSAFAESYLCISEAAGGVREKFSLGKINGLAYTTDTKWVVRNESGSWLVTEYGRTAPSFDYCNIDTVNTIRCGDHVGQVFYYHIDSGTYDTYMIRFSESYIDHVIERGRCTKI